jgi:DNA-binding GntR family transcriptional regulator
MGTNRGSKSLTDEAYYKIKQLILHQELIPGQKLIYDDLAKKLEMSRTPIINALNRLEQHGLVVSQSNRGFTVRPMRTKEAWDTYGSREAIETYSVEQVILKASQADLKKLEDKLIAYESYQPPYYDRKKIFLDADFHLQLVQLTDNEVLRWHLKLDLQHINLRANLNNYSIERMHASTEEHRLLLDRIKAKDILGAVETIRSHLQKDKKHVIACFSENMQDGESIAL